MTETLLYTPDRDSYSAQPSYPTIEIGLEGGTSRKRADFLFPPHIISVGWTLTTAVDYSRFMGFFRTTLRNGVDSFFMDLLSDIGELTKHRCRTLGGIPKLTRNRGNSYVTSCTLEVDVNPTYTGLITYVETERIVFNTTNPYLVGPIVTGDTIRVLHTEGIHPTGSTPLNLDGVYSVTGTIGVNVLELNAPAGVNSDWTVLAGLGATAQYGDVSNGNVISTITKVPT